MNDATLHEIARAKMNLRLRFTGRRADGYHLLSMLNVTLALKDVVSVSLGGSDIRCVFSGRESRGIDPTRNSVISAVRVFQEVLGESFGAQVGIEKNIPHGTGLGGASADAAAALRILCVANRKRVEGYCAAQRLSLTEFLARLAVKVGSDVPFLVRGGAAIVSGVGEIVKNIELDNFGEKPLFLCVPRTRIGSAEFYGFIRRASPTLPLVDDAELSGARFDWGRVLALVKNDFESYLEAFSPSVYSTLQSLRAQAGLVVGLTGSGSALFAIPTEPAAAQSWHDSLSAMGHDLGFDVFQTEFSTSLSPIAF